MTIQEAVKTEKPLRLRSRDPLRNKEKDWWLMLDNGKIMNIRTGELNELRKGDILSDGWEVKP